MKFTKQQLQLYAVTDRHWVGKQTLYEQVEAALKNGVTMVQLREKKLDDAQFLREAIKLRDLCHSYQVPFIVNDNVEIAIKSHADGIHVGQEDMAAKDVRKLVGPEMILGVSAHTVEEAKLAQENGADYLGIGAMFPTDTKKDADYVSLATLAEINQAVEIPSVAIGGINQDNLLQLEGTGIAGVSVISAIFGAKDIGQATRELLKITQEILEEK